MAAPRLSGAGTCARDRPSALHWYALCVALLSESTAWVYVWPHSTSFAEFHFGIGDRSIWFNGQLNIEIRVSEEPPSYSGSGGMPAGGSPPAGGWGGFMGIGGSGGGQ